MWGGLCPFWTKQNSFEPDLPTALYSWQALGAAFLHLIHKSNLCSDSLGPRRVGLPRIGCAAHSACKAGQTLLQSTRATQCVIEMCSVAAERLISIWELCLCTQAAPGSSCAPPKSAACHRAQHSAWLSCARHPAGHWAPSQGLSACPDICVQLNNAQ